MTNESKVSHTAEDNFDINRRQFVSSTGTIFGINSSGFSINQVVDGGETEFVIEEIVKISEAGGPEYYAVTVVREDTGEVVQRYINVVGDTDGSVEVIPVSESTYQESVTEEFGEFLSDRLLAGEHLIEKSEKVSNTTGGCAKYNGYEHQFRGTAIKFKRRVSDIGIPTAMGAVATVLSSAGLAALVVGVGGLLALVNDTRSITIGINEVDIFLGYVAGYKSVIAIGYNVTNEANFMSPGNAVIPFKHPFRETGDE